jgi:hypothetical protein
LHFFRSRRLLHCFQRYFSARTETRLDLTAFLRWDTMCTASDSSRKRHKAAYLAPARTVIPQPNVPVDVEAATGGATPRQETTGASSDTSTSASSSEVSFTASPSLHFLAWFTVFVIVYQGVVNVLVLFLIVASIGCWFWDIEVRLVRIRSLRPTTSRMIRPSGRIVIQPRVLVQDRNQLVLEDSDFLVDV